MLGDACHVTLRHISYVMNCELGLRLAHACSLHHTHVHKPSCKNNTDTARVYTHTRTHIHGHTPLLLIKWHPPVVYIQPPMPEVLC